MIPRDPRLACGYMGRGQALLGKGQPGRARADLNQAVQIDPSLSDVVGRTISDSKMFLGAHADSTQ